MKKRTYIVVDENNRDTKHQFKGIYPCRTAKKLASRGYTEIRLRQTTKKTIHIFKGWRTEKDTSDSTLEWLRKIKFVGHAKKVRIERIK